MTSSSVTNWIQQLKLGEAEAARELWERYFRRLVELARHKLAGAVRSVNDEEDVALSAFHSFCQAAGAGRFPRLDSRDDLWQLLVMHTARKAVDERRYQGRKKRSGKPSEVPIEEIVGAEPGPAFAAALVEEFEQLMAALDDDLTRKVALQKLEGYNNREIADRLHCSPRTVDRKLAVIRGVWQEISDK